MIPLTLSRMLRTLLLIGSRKLKTPCFTCHFLSVKIGIGANLGLGQCMGCFNNDHNKEKYFHTQLTSTAMYDCIVYYLQ